MHWREFQRKQKVAQIDGKFLSYVDEGAGDPVVLLHGIPTWGYLWQDLIVRLSKAHRLLAPDLLGFGYSDKSDRFDRSIARQAEYIDRWMKQMGVERAVIIGHDIGGGVALRLATLFPERAARVCVLNTVCYDSWPIELMLQFGHPGANRKMSASTAMAMLRQALKRGFASSPDGELLDGLLAPYSTEIGKLSLIRDAAALNTNLTTELTPLLPRLEIPVLVIWGEDDSFQEFKYGRRLASDIRTSGLVPVPDARHFVMLDQPERVAAELSSFIAAAQTPLSRKGDHIDV